MRYQNISKRNAEPWGLPVSKVQSVELGSEPLIAQSLLTLHAVSMLFGMCCRRLRDAWSGRRWRGGAWRKAGPI